MNSLIPAKPTPSSAAWVPTPEFINTTNLAWLMRRVGVDSHEALHAWSVANRAEFWAIVIERLGIHFQRPFSRVMDLSAGVEAPRWLVDAQLNIVESCFRAPPDSPAIVYQSEGGEPTVMTVAELAELTGRVASSLTRRGFQPGDVLAIVMPMTVESVAIYLGIIQAGCVVTGIADSFRPKEIAVRLRLSQAVGVFTQDVVLRGAKTFPLCQNLIEAAAPAMIVLPAQGEIKLPLRAEDCAWKDFLTTNDPPAAALRGPSDPLNILFSSGTTGEPKGIPWTQTTPIKCAMDAHFHQNIQPGDVLIWPTSLGWMMGPWLVFASLLNRATIALYQGAPTGRDFGAFVQNTKATLLGVVPSLVKTWRATGCMEGLDWSALKVFSSTGECSNAGDMRWLMSRAGGKPVIEYCGGTEIGGGYITGTVTQPCVPGAFNTPALGLDFVILDEAGQPADTGELFLIPPSIGLSNTLLNQDHHEIYFAGTPKGPRGETLRRHGDQMEKLAAGQWRGLGRADDTMNLGGIKISSAEIEEVLQSVPGVKEVAAIAVSPIDGPSQLVIFAALAVGATTRSRQRKEADPLDPRKNPLPHRGDYEADEIAELKTVLQNAIKRDLNPLFKIHELILLDALPRTASNKVLRRALRAQWRQPPPCT